MRDLRLRDDLQRAKIGDFALPLGIEPGELSPPTQGYTVDYNVGEDGPDTYAFHIVVSHERLQPIVRRAFELLPDHVYAIVEACSFDAYRAMDEYLSTEPIPRELFLNVWDAIELYLLEDGAIAIGANADNPLIEVFIDQSKGVWIHATQASRDAVEAMLDELGIKEVSETWPNQEASLPEGTTIRSVLDLSDDLSPDRDEVLLLLRQELALQLNIDADRNVDDAGRDLGPTLWHAIVIVESAHDPDDGAYASVWATAGSLAQMEQLVEQAIDDEPQWILSDFYAIDRVAYDERPEAMADLPPRLGEPRIHLVEVDRWARADDQEPETGDGIHDSGATNHDEADE